jgi:hypothetical protein
VSMSNQKDELGTSYCARKQEVCIQILLETVTDGECFGDLGLDWRTTGVVRSHEQVSTGFLLSQF